MLKTFRSAFFGAAFGTGLFFGIMLISNALVNKQQEGELDAPSDVAILIHANHVAR